MSDRAGRGPIRFIEVALLRATKCRTGRSSAIVALAICAVALLPGIGFAGAASRPSKTSLTAQAITFTSTPPKSPTVGGTYMVTATGGGSGNPVTFSMDSSSTSGACSISGATVSLVGAGTCVIDAKQAGNATYSVAPQVQQSFTIVASGSSGNGPGSSPPNSSEAPNSPPIEVCGNRILTGPASAPAGAIIVPSGNNSSVRWSAKTTYYFATGTHTLGTSGIPDQPGDTFVGAPGAILNGDRTSTEAFQGDNTGVTVEYLTIEDFNTPMNQMVVNHNGASNWTVEFNTIENNGGGGVGLATNSVVSDNCLTNNSQYGFQSFANATNVVLTNNEIGYNDTSGLYDQLSPTSSYAVSGDVATVTTVAEMNNVVGTSLALSGMGDLALNGTWTVTSVPNATTFTFSVTTANVGPVTSPAGRVEDAHPTCGCSGGGKLTYTTDAMITGNYIHDNGNVGIWIDTDNAGFDISDNYISNNWNNGIEYEVSYNALISDNTLIDNAWGTGADCRQRTCGGPFDAAILISGSGGNSSVSSNYSGSLTITDNVFTDNWNGVVLFQDPNRFCGASGPTGGCTLSNPAVFTAASCNANIAEKMPIDYFDNCQWKTQNVTVSDNVFNFVPAELGPLCTGATFTPVYESDWCGFNAIFAANDGLAPFAKYVVPEAISNTQGNLFENNIYRGPWAWGAFVNGSFAITQAQWTAGVIGIDGGAGNFTAQDARSTFNPAWTS